MNITRVCPITGVVNSMEIDCSEEQLNQWKNGALIQHAMPHLSADEREFIVSGMTPEVWEKIFGDEDE